MTNLTGSDLNSGFAVGPKGEGTDSPSSYPAYPEYQNINIKWNKSAPKHWKPSKLKFDSYIKARVGWHGLKSEDFTDEGPYLVTGSDFSGKEINWSKCYHCDVARYKQDPYIQLKDDDLLITKDGTIGKVILAGKLPAKATLNSGVFVLRPLNNIYLTKFYYWLMQSSVFHGFVEYYRTGSTILHLYQETFCNIPYALPTQKEQKQIAAFLDKETAKIDTLIEKQEKLIKLLQEKRQAVISHAVTKGLNPDVKMKDSGVEWLGEVPEHWDILKGSWIGRLFGSESVPEEEVKPHGTIPFVKVSSLSRNGFNLETMSFFIENTAVKRFKTKSNYIVFPKRGAAIFTNKVNIVEVESIIDPNLMGWVIVKIARPKFVAYLLKLRGLEDIADVSSVPQINNKHIDPMKLPIPPISEQEDVIDFLEGKTSQIDILINKAESVIDLIKERRTALISAVVTGKIDVRGFVGNGQLAPKTDQPASDRVTV